MDAFEKDVAKLQAIYEEVDDTIACVDLSESDNDSVVDDCNIFSEHETDSEQETFSDDEAASSTKSKSKYFFGRDGTKWNKTSSPPNVKVRSEDIDYLPGALGEAKNAESPLQCWTYLFQEIVALIVLSTNLYIDKIASQFKDKYDAKKTTEEEITALIGLLYLAGYQNGGRKNLSEFYQNDGLGSEIFPATMAQRRLTFLLRCLKFDNVNTREERKFVDNLAPVREMVTLFNKLSKKHYSVGEYVVLDEMLLAFQGKCRFKMFIPKKPRKYGLKLFSLVDARTFYTSHVEIYAGNQPDGPFKVENSPAAVTERMCLHLSGTGRNVTMDRWFTEHNIVSKLLREHSLTVVGTIRSNKEQLPPQLTQIKGRQVHSSVFAFGTNMVAVSYVPKKSKNMLLISTMHNDDKVDQKTKEAVPGIVSFYNVTKGAVDVVDRMVTSYNVARNTRRWPMVIFYGLLNIAAINAYVVYRANQPDGEFSKSRRQFLKNLGQNLVKGHMQQRATSQFIPIKVREAASRLSGVSTPKELPDPPPSKRGHCKYCKRRKTRFFCKFCKCWLCMEHIVACCRECAGDKQDPLFVE